ncbi:MAG: type II toxin-antitoxin system VapC family toxin [Candidatus Bathyarchaeia archaeon]
MRYLLDASALVPLITKFGKDLIARAATDRFLTTDLAIYEACNTLWKMSSLLGSISLEDGLETVSIIRELTERDTIHLIGVSKVELAATLRLASEQKLTFYDASYVTIAQDQRAALVTQDRELSDVARKSVEVLNFTGLERRIS